MTTKTKVAKEPKVKKPSVSQLALLQELSVSRVVSVDSTVNGAGKSRQTARLTTRKGKAVEEAVKITSKTVLSCLAADWLTELSVMGDGDKQTTIYGITEAGRAARRMK